MAFSGCGSGYQWPGIDQLVIVEVGDQCLGGAVDWPGDQFPMIYTSALPALVDFDGQIKIFLLFNAYLGPMLGATDPL